MELGSWQKQALQAPHGWAFLPFSETSELAIAIVNIMTRGDGKDKVKWNIRGLEQRLQDVAYLSVVTEGITVHAKTIQHRAQGSNSHGKELQRNQEVNLSVSNIFI